MGRNLRGNTSSTKSYTVTVQYSDKLDLIAAEFLMRRLTLTVHALANIFLRKESYADRKILRSDAISAMATAPPPEERSWWRLDPGIGILLALPAVLAALNSTWLYNSPGAIDPWVYFGYFLYLKPFKATFFPNLYYGSRLPWLLPGYLVHRMFDVTTAKYVLHFSFYYMAVFSFYWLLKRAVGQRSALMGALVFGTHAAFLSEIGWDYVDGAGLTYNLVGLACMARAASERRPWPWLMLGGAAVAAMFYTNLFLIAFVPFVPALYIFLKLKIPGGVNWLALLRLVGWFGAGFLLLTSVLGVANRALDGRLWFYAPSVTAFLGLSSHTNPWRVSGLEWLRGASWLGVPAMTAMAGVLYIALGVRRRSLGRGDFKTFFVFLFLTELAGMIVWYSIGGVGLQLNYYASYLLPSMFLAVGCMLAIPMERWQSWVYWLWLLAVASAFALTTQMGEGILAYRLHKPGFAAMVACGAIALVIKVSLPPRWLALVVALCGLWVYQVAFGGMARPTAAAPDSFARIVDSARAVSPHMHANPVLFWYDIREPAGWEFNAVNAIYLWGYTQIGNQFPAIASGVTLQAGRTGVILSGRGQVLEQANQALRSLHLKADSIEEDTINRGSITYRLIFFRLDEDIPNLQPLAIRYEKGIATLVPTEPGEFLQNKWILGKYPGTQARMETKPEGVLVTTAPRRFAYGSEYGPLIASRSGVYRFVLKYKVLDGSLIFGGMSADMQGALGRANLYPPTGKTQIATYLQPLKAGEGIVLLLANDAPESGHASTYLIESLEAAAQFEQK